MSSSSEKVCRTRAFSLIELVIVVVIIGVISAIAIPRMTRAANNAGAAALKANLSVLRSAIELYRAEHEGALPTVANIAEQLTMYTKIGGTDHNEVSDAVAGRIYGPYVRNIPPLPVGDKKGKTKVDDGVGANVGWVYNATTGAIIAGTNAKSLDADGVRYSTY